MEEPSTSEFAVNFIGVIPNENYAGLDDFGRTDFLRIYDRAQVNKVIKTVACDEVDFKSYVLRVLTSKIQVIERKSKNCCFEVSIPLIFSCGSLSEDGLVLFTFNIAPYQANQNYRDLLVLALPDEKTAEKLSEELNAKFARFAEQQLQTASLNSKSLSSLEASSPRANLDTPLTDDSRQSSDFSKAINEASLSHFENFYFPTYVSNSSLNSN
uniref:Uncharacterized protein n=1 Tax=Caenorhabditis japonica TaxID=281687 RepID=A0A8R1EB38_CAEJA